MWEKNKAEIAQENLKNSNNNDNDGEDEGSPVLPALIIQTVWYRLRNDRSVWTIMNTSENKPSIKIWFSYSNIYQMHCWRLLDGETKQARVSQTKRTKYAKTR